MKIGDSVYVGGGMGKGDLQVFLFNTRQETWTPLPHCPTIQHGLTTLDGELIAIGGQMKYEIVSTVYTFRSNSWIKALPPMPTPRMSLSTMSYDNSFIIAAGGRPRQDRTRAYSDKVEVFIKERRTWFSAKPLPFGVSTFSMCIISDTCYILGGTGREDEVNIGLHAMVSSILEKSTRSPWKQLQGQHPLSFASPVELDGRLVAVGGSSHPIQRCGINSISMYDFATDTWQVCRNARLPVPLYRAGVVKLDGNQVMLVGGQPKSQQFSAAVYIGSYEC